MSKIELVSHHDPALKQHKKKKRRRDDGEEEVVDEPKTGKKKRKKYREESADDVPPIVEANSDVQEAPVATEKKRRKKEKRERVSGSVNVAEECAPEPSDAKPGTETKKRKRKHDSEGVAETSADLGEEVGAPRERKKIKKRRGNSTVDTFPENESAGTSTVSLQDVSGAPAKKKKKSKEKQAPNPSLSLDVPTSTSDSMFPLPNYMTYTAFFPGAQPSMSLFPTPNNLPFPDLAFGSNEDVLRALQDLDISKIAGVLKTLTDAADAANIPTPLTGIPSTSTLPSLAAASSASTISSKLASPSSDLPSHPDHAHLLASKWMGPTKLAELVASEGLVYKKGKFSAIEIGQINEAIEKYRTIKGLSEENVNQLIFPSDEKQKDTAFWTEITSAVSQRPIIAVYHYVRRARHPMKQQGKWRPDEDAKLIEAVTSLGQQWEKVGQMVGRMSADCRDRYRNHIVDREKRVAGTWSTAEEDRLTQIVTKMTKGKDLDNDIFWGKVSQQMGGTRSRQQCRIKWTDSLSKKYKTEGQYNPRWSSRDAFILIHKIDALNVRDDTEIDWKTIPDSQWNLWSAHTLQRRWLTMKKGVKGFEDMSHPEIMDILRVKNAEEPHLKVIKSAKFVADSDDDEHRPGPSTGPGTLAGMGEENEDDSE